MPMSAKAPKIATKPSGLPETRRAATPPMTPKGAALTTRNRRLKLCNWIIRIVYCIVHTMCLQLKAQGTNGSWETIRDTLSNQVRITTTLQCRDGRAVHVRKASRPEPHQQKIYAALDLSPNPGGTQRTIV
jgi:hypothetical protein